MNRRRTAPPDSATPRAKEPFVHRTAFGVSGGLGRSARLHGVNDQEILRLLPAAAAAVAADAGADSYLARLGGYDEHDQAQVDRCLHTFLAGLIRAAWERGWAPADVVQHGRRQLESSVEPLLLAVIASEHRSYQESTIDPRWQDQLAEIDLTRPFVELDLTTWAKAQRIGRYLALPQRPRARRIPPDVARPGPPVPSPRYCGAPGRSLRGAPRHRGNPEDARANPGSAGEGGRNRLPR